MDKDFWDKLNTVGTFLSTTVIVVFTTIVTYNTSKLSNQVENFGKRIDENKMIGELVSSLSSDTISTFKSDFALLALERYLRNGNEDGILMPQDKEMLVGFAQSLIINGSKKDSVNAEGSRYSIPRDFLYKYDVDKWNTIVGIYSKETKDKIPDKVVTNKTVASLEPVSQVSDSLKSSLMTSILKKIAYIQYAGTEGKAKAETLQQSLKDGQWAVPKTEEIKGSYSNVIKYFHPEDRDYALEANRLMGDKFQIVPSLLPKYQKVVPIGQIEIWISDKP